MNLNFNWVNLLILFGAVQGLIFGVILLLNKRHPGARFLSIFMLVLSFNGFETFSWSSGLDDHILFFDLFGYVTIYALGPSLYWYIYSLLHPQEKPSSKQVLPHYFPALFQFFICICFACLYYLYLNGLFNNDTLLEKMYAVYSSYGEPLSVVSFLVYLYLSFRLFNKRSTGHMLSYISKEGQKVVYKWIRTLLILSTILGISWPLTVLAPMVFNLTDRSQYYPIEITLVLFIYWIAFVGYHRMKLIYIQTPKFATSIEDNAEEIFSQLKSIVERDKVYLDPGLTRQKLAEHTGINAKTISAILNQHANRSFNDFVNYYRVREVCEDLLSSKNKHLTISGVALASGFNSQATFQRAFKNIKGMSPKEYLALELKKMG